MSNCLRTLLMGAFLIVLHPSAKAQCNDYDLMLLCDSAEMVDIAVSAAALQCAFNPQPETCFSAAAVLSLPTMSSGCISCFASEATCALSNCATVCAFGSAAACDECVTSNCQASFEACAGIVDLDEDTHNNICDCDDNNPLQYPGAPGTNEGIDNNCNGLMEASEAASAACPGDLNGDNLVGAADLVTFLGHFGCILNCGQEDFDNDGLVGVADLVYLLGYIGLMC
ncbi:MAG: MopE-related protein [Flavobacteriales bacterium]